MEAGILTRLPDHVLRGPATDVDDHRFAIVIAAGGCAEERQPRLRVAGDGAGVNAVLLHQVVVEVRPVIRVAHGARGHRDDRLGAEPVDHLAVAGDRLGHPVHRLVGEPAGGVDVLAEPGDDRAALELDHLAVLDLRDQ
jgi:hypothetical protein